MEHNKKLTKAQIKKIARVWAGELILSTDMGFDEKELGITQEELDQILESFYFIGNKYVLEGNKMGTLKQIIDRVRSIKQ